MQICCIRLGLNALCLRKGFLWLCNFKVSTLSPPSDIYQHLPILAQFTQNCDSVAELGVRGLVSSWAFLYGLQQSTAEQKILWMNDIEPCECTHFLKHCKESGIDTSFTEANDLEVNIPQNST